MTDTPNKCCKHRPTTAMAVIAVSVLSASYMWSSHALAPAAADESIRLDVNDVSFLWPVPQTKQDIAGLLSIEETLADGTSSILPQKAFDALIETVLNISVSDSAAREHKIDFRPFKEQFLKRSTWKIAGLRVDPSAPGTEPMLVKARGSLPQMRLIVQPVTVDGDSPRVHDVTIHLVYNYVTGFKPPGTEKGPPIAIPDTKAFTEIVKALASLKASLKKAGVETNGKLTVHPGFKNDKAKDFAGQVKSFLTKQLSEDRLGAMAFMGIEAPEPWIFVALQRKKDKTFAPSPNDSIGGNVAQMLIMRGGTPVLPRPTTTNLDAKRGVSTALLFPNDVGKAKLEKAIFVDLPGLKHKDIPDLIANPRRAHFFNTDCVSCHSESSRRALLEINAGRSDFAYELPAGVSGVDESVLPKSLWNVRNFGWFPGRPTVATVTMRTANEAAESADFINKNYLGQKD